MITMPTEGTARASPNLSMQIVRSIFSDRESFLAERLWENILRNPLLSLKHAARAILKAMERINIPRTPTLETPRLLLLPLTLDDATPAQPLFAQWEIVRHLASRVPWPFPPDGCFTFYRDIALPAMARGDQWHWSIRTKTNPQQMIGSIALVAHPQDPAHPNNRGFWIGLPYQRRGYATEATIAVTDFWFDILGFPNLTVPKAHANEASRCISLSTGMTLLRTETHPFVAGPLPADIWHLTIEQWHQHRRAGVQSDQRKAHAKQQQGV